MDDGSSMPEADCARSSESLGDGLAVHVDRREIADCPPFSTECEMTTYNVTITVRQDGLREIVRGRGWVQVLGLHTVVGGRLIDRRMGATHKCIDGLVRWESLGHAST